MINQENLDIWLDELRVTGIPQAQGHLLVLKDLTRFNKTGRVAIDNVQGMCCLGVGEYLRTENLNCLADAALPPRPFTEWLGVYGDGDEDSVTLYVNWPAEILPRDYLDLDREFVPIEVASLNDGFKLTFPQIADVIQYFGLVTDEEELNNDQ